MIVNLVRMTGCTGLDLPLTHKQSFSFSQIIAIDFSNPTTSQNFKKASLLNCNCILHLIIYSIQI